MNQAAIFVLSILSVWCVTSRSEAVRRWGPVFGLCSQPFWLYATWRAGQYGMFSVSVIYTGMWARGIFNSWWAK